MILKKQGQIFELSSSLKLPISLEESWTFFSNPSNLKTITPDYMGFEIISELEKEMFAGQFICYKVSPLMGLKMNWVTEITHVVKNKYFVDEQRIGPYSMWHHKHFFKEIDDGTEVRDVVHYRLPVPLIANRFHSFLVKPKLMEIFEYRSKELISLFGAVPEL